MSRWRQVVWLLPMGLVACSSGPEKDTLADLHQIEPKLADVIIADSLERAEESYRRYLEETPSRVMAPEAMRRMADLQLEREFGTLGSALVAAAAVGDIQDLPATVLDINAEYETLFPDPVRAEQYDVCFRDYERTIDGLITIFHQRNSA